MTNDTRRKIAKILTTYYNADRTTRNKIRLDILTGIIKLNLPDEITRDYINEVYKETCSARG